MSMWRCLVALLAALAMAACSHPTARPETASLSDGSLVSLRFAPDDLASPILVARVCAPSGAVPWRVRFPLALINHGSPGSDEDRTAMQPASCDSPPMHWFTTHGYVAMALMRRGFGGSSGGPVENVGPCVAPDYAASGQAGAEDIAAGVRAGFAMGVVQPKDAVVVGQSTGGWAVLAYAGHADPRVKAAIVFAPGRGARVYPPPDSVCRLDLLTDAAAKFGEQSHLPVLWLATGNDSFFPPPIAQSLHAAFVQAGGEATLMKLDPFMDEGHAIFASPGGAEIWGPIVGKFLSRLPPG